MLNISNLLLHSFYVHHERLARSLILHTILALFTGNTFVNIYNEKEK